MWTLGELRDGDVALAEINGKWVPARPENFKKRYMTLTERVKDAWEVFTCRAEAFKWPEGQ